MPKETPRSLVAKKIRAYLDEHDMSGRELARRAGLSEAAVNHLLRSRSLGNQDTLWKVAGAMGRRYAWLAFDEGPSDVSVPDVHPRVSELAAKVPDARPIDLAHVTALVLSGPALEDISDEALVRIIRDAARFREDALERMRNEQLRRRSGG